MSLPVLFRILSIGLILVTNWAILPPVDPGGSIAYSADRQAECTYVIPPEETVVDGLGNYAQVKPGDTLCLPAGTRDNIKFVNLHGTESLPITIRNSDGVVVITGTLYLTGGIGIIDSTNIHLTGTGVSYQCGAAYPTEKQKCGIEITRTNKGIKVDTTQGTIENIEIDHVSIHDIQKIEGDIETRGINFHPVEGQTVYGLHVHHNYISQIPAEGIYLGSEPAPDVPLEQLGKLENVEISYNWVENTGYDGINLKVAVKNVQVHHNVVDDTGLAQIETQQGGLKIVMSVGSYYNNLVFANNGGIRMGRPLENPGTRYFNNVVVGSNTIGIEALEGNAQIYNNTIVNSQEIGINAPGNQSLVFNNIVVGTIGPAIQGNEQNLSNNLVGPIASAGFVDHKNRDYRLRRSSPAIDAASPNSPYPKVDFMGITRPQGSQIDIGAFEFPVSSFLNILLPRNADDYIDAGFPPLKIFDQIG